MYLYVYVYSGLMSRCATLADAYYLMKREGIRKLTVIWPLEKDCGIHFKEVFEDSMFSDIKLKVIEQDLISSCDESVDDIIGRGNYIGAIRIVLYKLWYNRKIYWQRLLEKKIPKFIFRENYFDYSQSLRINGGIGEEPARIRKELWKRVSSKLKRKESMIYVKTYGGIIKNEEREKVDYTVVKFRKQYNERASRIIKESEGECVGVHIRRTDHRLAKRQSTTNAFLNKMNEIIEENPDVKFFLATDDIAEENTIKEIFGDRIVTQKNKKWGRENSGEMQSGIVDFLCLTRCKYILGSSTSVFSSFAAKYTGKDLIICRE